MGFETTIVGLVGIVLGIAIYIKTSAILPAIIPLILGVAIIFFSKENQREIRKDKK